MGTAVSNPASFSSIRSACSAEGYGSSTNFTGYNRGGGIVPDHANTAGVSATDAGLAMSQFSGITIPSTGSHHTSSISHAVITAEFLDSAAPANSGTATTEAVSVSIVNPGVGPYTYAWARVSGDVMTLSAANASSTTFATTAMATAPATNYSAVYRCTITDTGDSNYQTTQDVSVTTTHSYEP